VPLSLSLETDCARDRTPRSLPPSSSNHVVLHRWCAVDAAESGWTSWTALPAAGHVHSAAVSSTPRPHSATMTRWRTTPTCGYDRPTQRSPYSTPRPVVAVQRCDMHVLGRHREQRPQRTQRDARNRGAVVVVVVSRCSRSIAASVACRPPPRR